LVGKIGLYVAYNDVKKLEVIINGSIHWNRFSLRKK
jgi:hypothetical protein